MSTISAGLVKLTGNLNVTSSESSGVTATTVTTNTLNAEQISTDVFNFQQANVDVSGNLIVRGTTTVSNLTGPSGSLPVTGNVAASGDMSAGNFKIDMNSLLTNINLSSGNDKFSVTVDDFGVLRIVSKENPIYTGGTFKMFKDARPPELHVKDYQNYIYLYNLISILTDPFGFALIGKYAGYSGVDAQDSYRLTFNLNKQEIEKAYMNNEIPPLLVSLAAAFKQALSDAYAMSVPRIQITLSPLINFTLIDIITLIACFNVNCAVGGFSQVSPVSSGPIWNNYMMDFIKKINNIDSSNGIINSLGVYSLTSPYGTGQFNDGPGPFDGPIDDRQHSSQIAIGKDLLSDAKSWSFGAPHYNLTGVPYGLVRVITDDGLDQVTMAVALMGNESLSNLSNKSVQFTSINVSTGVDNYFFDVVMNPATKFNSYFIGQEEYPVEWRTVTMPTYDISPSGDRLARGGGGPAARPITRGNVTTQTLQVPFTKYGPIFAMNDGSCNSSFVTIDSSGVPALKLINQYLVYENHAVCYKWFDVKAGLRGFARSLNMSGRVTNVDEALDDALKNNIPGLNNSQNDVITYDSTGKVGYFQINANFHLNQKAAKVYEEQVFNPKSDNDFIKSTTIPFTSQGGNFYLNGSDLNVYNAFVSGVDGWQTLSTPDRCYGQTTTGMAQASNQGYQAYIMDDQPDLPNTAHRQWLDTAFMMESIGSSVDGSGVVVPNELEATRVSDTSSYIVAMEQIQNFLVMRNKDFWNWTAVYKRLNVVKYDPDASENYFVTGDASGAPGSTNAFGCSPWNAPIPMTISSARSIGEDTTPYLIIPFWNELRDFLITELDKPTFVSDAAARPYFAGGVPGAIANGNGPQTNFGTRANTGQKALYNYEQSSSWKISPAYNNSFVNTTNINSTVISTIKTLLQTWTPENACDVDKQGTSFISQIVFNALSRIISEIYYVYRSALQRYNTIYNGRPCMTNGTAALVGLAATGTTTAGNTVDMFYNSCLKNTYDPYTDSLPNFTKDSSGIYHKTRNLNKTDLLDIFKKTFDKPNGFDPSKVPETVAIIRSLIGDENLGTVLCNGNAATWEQLPYPKTVGELFLDSLVDTLYAFNQLDSQWYLTWVNEDLSIRYERSSAPTLQDKIMRTWGSMATCVQPFDYSVDPSGNPIPDASGHVVIPSECGSWSSTYGPVLNQYPHAYGTDSVTQVGVIRYSAQNGNLNPVIWYGTILLNNCIDSSGNYNADLSIPYAPKADVASVSSNGMYGARQTTNTSRIYKNGTLTSCYGNQWINEGWFDASGVKHVTAYVNQQNTDMIVSKNYLSWTRNIQTKSFPEPDSVGVPTVTLTSNGTGVKAGQSLATPFVKPDVPTAIYNQW